VLEQREDVEHAAASRSPVQLCRPLSVPSRADWRRPNRLVNP
jgi:hypothetical protein